MEFRRDYRDDPSILDSELLYRGIHKNNQDNGRVTSGAFLSRTNPHVSVDLESLSSPQETHQRRPTDAGVIQLTTRIVRRLTPGVTREPIEDNLAHALIISDFDLSRSQRKAVAHALAEACDWAISPHS